MLADATPGYVLLPGLDGTGDLFAAFGAVLTHVSQSFTVVRLPTETVEDYRQLADLVAPQVDLTGNVLVAESFSGPLALHLAARQPPGTIAGVVLVASFVRPPVSRMLAWLPWQTMFSRRPPDWAIRRYLLDPGASRDVVTHVLEAVATVPAGTLAHRVRLLMSLDARRQLRECPTRVLYLQATRDKLVGQRSMEEILRIRGDAIVCRVDAPHLLLQSAPEAAWATMREHRFQPVDR